MVQQEYALGDERRPLRVELKDENGPLNLTGGTAVLWAYGIDTGDELTNGAPHTGVSGVFVDKDGNTDDGSAGFVDFKGIGNLAAFDPTKRLAERYRYRVHFTDSSGKLTRTPIAYFVVRV